MVQYVSTESMPIVRLASAESHIVDDLIQGACENNGIPPVYRYLTGLYDFDKKTYLSAHEKIGGDEKHHELQLRIRFHPLRSELLEEPKTLNLYYKQMLYYLLNEFKFEEYSHELVSQLVGFVAMDYVNQLIEKDEYPTFESTVELLDSSELPADWKFPWWKKKVVKKDFVHCVQRCFNECKLGLASIKHAFIDSMCEVLPGCRQQHFKAQILLTGVSYDVQVIVGHLSYGTAQADEGPFLRIFQEKAAGDNFPIAQMSYLIPLSENTVEVHLRDEHPIVMRLDARDLVEFCTLMDGYYRMTERFTARLCCEFQPPSIEALKKRKIHGPIRASVARKKLSENVNRQLSFLIRQDQLNHGICHVDIMSADGAYTTQAVFESEDAALRLGKERDGGIPSLEVFMSVELPATRPARQLSPNNRDRTGLQLCRQVSADELNDFDEPDAQLLNLKKFKLASTLRSNNPAQKVFKGTYDDSVVALRVLQDDNPTMMKRFLRKASETPFWKCREILPIVGLGIAPQVCLATEFMPLGSLDAFLKDPRQCVTVNDLGRAALCLTKAVWYLEDNGFVHGRIRCRSVFVADGTKGSFRVKLGEPGLAMYDDGDVPWIAPEYFSDMDSVMHAQKADIYALGTTLWEIFNRVRSPFEEVAPQNAREFFASGQRLCLADVPREFRSLIAGCWSSNPDSRNEADEMIQSLSKLLHQLDELRGDSAAAQTASNTKKRSANVPAAATNAALLPTLRHLNQNSTSNLQRRHSAASQSSIASRRGWKTNRLLKYFLKRDTDYDTLSCVSSVAPSQHTLDTDIPDERELNSDSPEGDDEAEDALDPSGTREWNFERSNLRILEPVGQGFFGMVFKATLTRPDGTIEVVAAKRVKGTVADFSHKNLEREIEIMKKLRHPNIVEIIGQNDAGERLLVMEFVSMGALSAYLVKHRNTLTRKELLKFGCDIASAMAYLERKKIIHRNLAARNILVESESCVKLSDFGLAHLLNNDYFREQTMEGVLPIKWYAPESILYNKFTARSDVWSYGVALWEMFSFAQDPVVEDSNDPKTIGNALVSGKRLPCPIGCPPDIYQLMRDCWETSENSRPCFAKLLVTITNMYEASD